MANNSKAEQGSSGSETSSNSKKYLRPNPFTTYRDPQTGRWVVVKPVAA
ncbi:MAG TPA: hypothetical protein V6C78_23515 [Crinalium sp.]|jgi:hypothetical protein